MKNKEYYIFWSAVALIITVVMTASVVGLQVWMTNQEESCPMEVIQIKSIEVPVKIELHEPPKEIGKPFKWVDPENQTIHYVYPDGYDGTMIPMYGTVPPVWYENMLKAYRNIHGEQMPIEIIEAVPWEWKNAVMPQPKPLPKGGSAN